MATSVPGFVDLQVNGFVGIDYSNAELTEESFVHGSSELLKRGTIAFLPTVITNTPEVYRRNLPIIAKGMSRPEFEGRLLGIHLEGPYFSGRPGSIGAHNPAWVQPANVDEFRKLQDWADGKVKLITIGADVPGADKLARYAVDHGVAVSVGHHLADEEDLQRLADAGATMLTHLGNGLPNELHRHRNPIWAGLACDDLKVMLISDGHHLPASVVKVMLKAKGIANVAVVSDASSIAGCPPGRYSTLNNEVVLEPNGLLHNPIKKCLVGSSATMIECMNFLIDAKLATAQECITLGYANPLKFIGMSDWIPPGAAAVEFDGRFSVKSSVSAGA